MKKKMKQIIAFALAAVMMLAMSMTAFATEATGGEKKGSITIDNPIEGQTYTAYKIFDVVYSDGEDKKFSYTIDETSPWFVTVQKYANAEDTTNADGITLEEVATGGVYNVIVDSTKFSASKFSAALKEAKITTGGFAFLKSVNGAAITLNDLELGYYFVSSTSGALCNLTTTTPAANIRDKNDNPFEKEDDTGTVQIGQKVPYTITAKVPDTTGFEKFTWEVTDTMSDGLTFNKDVTVKIGDTDVTGNVSIQYDNVETNAFVLNIDMTKYQTEVGKEVKITYSATVNEKAIVGFEKNNAKLEYTNNPDGTTDEITKTERVYTGQIVVDKYDAADTTKATKLAGAKFVLYKEDEPGKQLYYYLGDTIVDEETGETKKQVEWNEKPAEKTWEQIIAENNQGDTRITVAVTDQDGAASFAGLEAGTYYLLEVEAPAGYNKAPGAVKLTIKELDDETIDSETYSEQEIAAAEVNLTQTAEVANNTGTELPETGGIGTTIFYVVGILLMAGAVFFLVMNGKKEQK